MSLTDRPRSERPREKLLQRGLEFLSDSEQVAILLRTDLPGQDAISLAHALIERFSGLYGLLSAPSSEFTKTLGLGPAKTAQCRPGTGPSHATRRNEPGRVSFVGR